MYNHLVYKLIKFIKALSFWKFISLFVCLAIIISECLIIVQSFLLYGELRQDLLIVGFITPAIDAFVVLFITAIVLDELKRETKLRYKTEEYLRSTINNFPFLVWLKDKKSRFLTVNEPYAKACDRNKVSEVEGLTDLDIWPKTLAEKYRLDDKTVIDNGQQKIVEELVAEHGTERWFETFKSPVFDNQGGIVGTVGFSRDISERKSHELELKLAATVFENTVEGVVITGTNAEIIKINGAFTTITGYSAEEAVGQRMSLLHSGRHTRAYYEQMWLSLTQTGRWQGEIWNRRKDGSVYPQMLSINAVYEHDRIIHFVAVMLDISHIKESEQRLDYLANHDPLTGLPNRRCMQEQLSSMMLSCRKHNECIAVLFLDLDRFKLINDSLGHGIGDKILKESGQRLNALIRDNDFVSRLGGDEFVILLKGIESATFAEKIAKKIIHKLNEPFIIDNHSHIHLGTSIGITLFPHHGDTIEQLIKNADTAMYRAKESGRNRVHFYSEELSHQAEKRFSIENGIRRALENEELSLYYQPQFDTATQKILGVEVLVRWQDPEQGLITPDQFIHLAEETGQIMAIDHWALENEMLSFPDIHRLNPGIERISVNLSGVHLKHGDVVTMVKQLLDQTGMAPAFLELELTENTFIDLNEGQLDKFQQLVDLGVQLAIDDFGTGYSSLSYLKQLPVERIKIDRSFFTDIPHDIYDIAITRAIIALGKTLGLGLVAEGLETAEQLKFITDEGCNMGQGNLFSPPLSLDNFLKFISKK